MKRLLASVASLTRRANRGTKKRLIFLLALTLGAGGAFGLPALRIHASIANTALILDTTVTPDASLGGVSLEQSRAQAHGFTVTVITGTTWSTMTAADFAKYQLIILGDPTCNASVGGATHAPAVANESWESAVLASGGNVAVIGTDPVFHNKFGGGGASPTGSGGAFKLVDKGIAFSGAIAGATGAYVDLSCIYAVGASSTPVPLLDGLSSHGPKQFTVSTPPCLGSIAIVAATGPTAGLTDADLSGWGCSVHEYFNTWPSDYTVLALATDPTVAKTYTARDVSTGMIVSGSPYILVRGTGVTISSNISLSPASATNPAGPTSSHTVTATVLRGTSPPTPVVGTKVTFRVESGPNAGQTFTGLTDNNGQVSWTYFDTGGVGMDSISATFVDDLGATEKATATKTWVSSEQNITASPNSFSATEGQAFVGQKVASFCDPNTTSTAAEYSATIDWGDSTGTFSGNIVPAGACSSGPGNSFNVTGDHTYAEEKSYSLTVTITDVDTPSNTATVHPTATVNDAAIRAACATPIASTQNFSGFTATFTDQNSGATSADFTANIAWGDSSSSAGTIGGGPGSGPYTVSGTHTYASTGLFTITTTIKDDGGASDVASCKIFIGAFPTANGGTFVVGDLEATGPGAGLTWWGSQWATINQMSGGPAPASMKGFAGFEDMPLPAGVPLSKLCGMTWTTDTGNATPPPQTVPGDMFVIVSSHITQNGSVISGDIKEIILVHNNPGYGPDPGHTGTGTEVILVC
jgi:hypothetical protein